MSDAAPVIPAVETSAPLSEAVDVPAVEPAAEAPAAEVPATNGEKKEIKSDKRKSSLPFNFGGKKAAASEDEGEKVKSPSAFSKIRATIKV